MRPIAYDITPQGFRVPLYDDKRRGDGPDSLVVESCALLASDPSGFTHSWDFQRKIINRGLDLFGDFHQFLKAQDMHGNLTVHQRGFLKIRYSLFVPVNALCPLRHVSCALWRRWVTSTQLSSPLTVQLVHWSICWAFRAKITCTIGLATRVVLPIWYVH